MDTQLPRSNRGYILAVLVLVNISCECSRYLLNYLSAVTLAECNEPCASTAFQPLCKADCCGSKACADCRSAHRATHYSILDGSCISRQEYGLLAGPAFALVYATTGVFAGRITDRYNPKLLHLVAILVWSTAVLAMAGSHAFWHMFMARLLLGLGESFQGPCSYALISQCFPLSSRSRANGIYSFGIYIGGGVASLSIVLSMAIGWRYTCVAYGLVGVGVGLLYGATVARQSQGDEGRYILARRCCSLDGGLESSGHSACPPALAHSETHAATGPANVLGALRAVLRNRRVVLLCVAASLRFYAGNSIAAFLPVYMGRAFPHDTRRYSLFNAVIVSVGGGLAAYAGGHVADAWAKSKPSAHAWVPCLGSVLAIVPWAGVVLSGQFLVAMLCLVLEYLMAEGWLGPALTILQESLPSEVQGLGVGVLLFCCTVVGELAPVLIGAMEPGNANGLAPVLFWNVAVAYALSGAVFLVLAVSGQRGEGEASDRQVTLLSSEVTTSSDDKEVKAPP